jgi:hypothetical protein
MKTSQRVFHLALCCAALCALVFCAASLCAQQKTASAAGEIWRFDRIDSLGGHPTTVLGHPQVIDTPYGKAVQFNGVDDALFVGVHPLAHDATWTWEVIFRPDADGAFAQRFFHLQEQDATGADTPNHMTLETRVQNGQWYLDAFAVTGANRLALIDPKLLHPAGKWYRITFVYDGKELRSYLGDDLQGSGPIQLAPQGDGHSSVGTRINKQYYFKGAMLMARFTPRALPPDEFLKFPPAR